MYLFVGIMLNCSGSSLRCVFSSIECVTVYTPAPVTLTCVCSAAVSRPHLWSCDPHLQVCSLFCTHTCTEAQRRHTHTTRRRQVQARVPLAIASVQQCTYNTHFMSKVHMNNDSNSFVYI